jgi:hypothetical protein
MGMSSEKIKVFDTNWQKITDFYKEISNFEYHPDDYEKKDLEKFAPTVPSTAMGARLAKVALSVDAQMSGTGRCKKGVRLAFEAAGLGTIYGVSAYMAAPQLAKRSDFKEVSVSREQLRQLPAGAVIVWNNGGGSAVSDAGREHGHIEISQGNGRATSDYTGDININRPVSYRVFIPKS